MYCDNRARILIPDVALLKYFVLEQGRVCDLESTSEASTSGKGGSYPYLEFTTTRKDGRDQAEGYIPTRIESTTFV